jgi:hypothetical protein
MEDVGVSRSISSCISGRGDVNMLGVKRYGSCLRSHSLRCEHDLRRMSLTGGASAASHRRDTRSKLRVTQFEGSKRSTNAHGWLGHVFPQISVLLCSLARLRSGREHGPTLVLFCPNQNQDQHGLPSIGRDMAVRHQASSSGDLETSCQGPHPLFRLRRW